MKNRVQELRWKKGWSQLQLARISGVAQSTICAIENQECVPNLHTAFKLAQALSVSIYFLFELNNRRQENL